MKEQGPLHPHFDRSLVQGAIKPRFGEVRIRDRGRLLHWEQESGLYFVTFRLADSLPQEVLDKIVERNRLLESAKRSGLKLSPSQKVMLAQYSPRKIEVWFDRGSGACSLRDPRIAELVSNALRSGNEEKYRLIAWCIMPNHVHVVFRLLPGRDLAVVLKYWKAYTARTANRILGRTGRFWQREYYDRLIRDSGELNRAIEYVASNPQRAGLKEWRWVWGGGIDAPTTAGLESGATMSDA